MQYRVKIPATEMFKVSKSLVLPQMHEIFKLKNQPHYNLSYNSLFSRPLVKTFYKPFAIGLSFGGSWWKVFLTVTVP